jgi:hypothetical protein
LLLCNLCPHAHVSVRRAPAVCCRVVWCGVGWWQVLDKIRYLVLDEADRMLDMGFSDDVQKIVRDKNTRIHTVAPNPLLYSPMHTCSSVTLTLLRRTPSLAHPCTHAAHSYSHYYAEPPPSPTHAHMQLRTILRVLTWPCTLLPPFLAPG